MLLLATLLVVTPAALLGAAPVDAAKLPPATNRQVDFAKDIQPIFESACYGCHGPKKQESAFRLDQKAGALKGGESGVTIVPGKSAESTLIHAVAHAREDLKMPRKGDRLSSEQVGLLRAWVDQGAKWPEATASSQAKDPRSHWAFKAPVKPAAPVVKNKKWVRNPIDQFVLARLEKEGLKPSPEADKTTLLRRLHLDLIGLPPSIPEVDQFVANSGSKSYNEAVERLLKSPHHGERWGRHWLDAARYADSDGFEKDKRRTMYPYRDYVIKALNSDLPYNQFIIEQIAGDLLPNATQDQIVATGFLRNSMVNEEGGVDPEQFRMDAMFDRMDAIGKGILGLTIQCAQCHSHKFDPLTHEEYYKMFAFLNNDHEAQRAVFTPGELMKIEEIRRKTAEIEADLRHRTPGWEARMAVWEKEISGGLPQWNELFPVVEDISTGGQRYLPMGDNSFLAQGYAPTKHTVKMEVKTDATNITAFRLELLPDPNLPLGGPGRSFMGTSALTEFNVDVAPADQPTNRVKVKFARATSDYDQPRRALEPNFYDKSTNNRVTGPVSYALDGDGNTAWGIDAGPGRRNVARKAVFECATNISFPGGAILTFRLAQNHGGWNSDELMNNNLGRFRLSWTSAEKPTADPLPKPVRDLLAIPAARRSPAQQAAVFGEWRKTVKDFAAANAKIEELWHGYPEGSSSLTLMARTEPRSTQLLKRGDFLKPMRPVGTGVPAFLHPLPEAAAPDRLTFARWLADRRSPTTARVFVNRVWQAYFGTGLVSTPEDFGMQSDTPSHPELLDWLACEFMDSGWSLKALHRLIVDSATYRQSSRLTPELREKDAFNRLLARGARQRVEGEIVRDIALAASGLLNPKVGGRSVFPPAPTHLFMPPASYAPFEWYEEKDNEKYRRALYTFRRRSTPYPMLQTYDVPNADASCVRRTKSNTPLQALMGLNETLAMECAQALAARVLKEGGTTDAERVVLAFRLCMTRKPDAAEQGDLLAFLNKQSKRFGEGWLDPAKLGLPEGADISKLPPGTTPTQLAAWTAVSRVLLNLDETITRE